MALDQLVFLPDANSDGVLKFEIETGAYRGIIGAGFFAGGSPSCAAQNPVDGYLYVGGSTASGSTIMRFDPYTGTYAGQLGTGFVNAVDDIAFGADGLLYVANFATPPTIMRFVPATGEYRGLFASGFYGSGFVSLATIGNTIYASESQSIYRFDGPTGTYQGILGSGFIPGARGLAADDVRLYAGSNTNASVARFVAATGEYRGLIAPNWASSFLGIDLYGADMSLLRTNFISGGQGVMRFERSTGAYRGLLAANFNLSGSGIAVEQGAQVSGTLTLEDYVGAARLVEWEVVDGGGNVLDSGTIGPTTGGPFTFTTLARGTNTVRLKASHWLRRAANSVVIGRAGASGLSFSLLNGDVNNDNEVGPADFSLLSSAFGTFLGDPGYNAEADLNGDEEVGPADFSILASNFGEFGD